MIDRLDVQFGNQMHECLAWYMYPEPDGTGYDARLLSRPEILREVFDYCQIGLAIIRKEGWRFLFRTYGLAGIFAVNDQSQWFDVEDRDAGRRDLAYECLSAGYDPTNDSYGTYSEETGIFTTISGSKYEITW